MSRHPRAARLDELRFPRVSGDEPNLPPFYAVGYMFSPRERG